MTDAAIIQATFSEWRMVKGRKVLQIICEVPLEAQGQVFAALGAPMPDAETWVAIARLRSAEAEPAAIEQHKPPKSLAQLAGIICNEPAFWKFAQVNGADEAADYVRVYCGVTSRSALDSNDDAASKFKTLKADYRIWRDGLAA